MNAVISVVGKDCVGILATVSQKCKEANANILEVSQTVLNSYFAMIMLVTIDNLNMDFIDFVEMLEKKGREEGLEIHVMHEDIFNSMHKI
ncbi:MAG: ACT domain-containing protein [Bacteroidales bacterium]|nr:ACT domain-containing protein [Bacteroidales bacterium]